MLEILLLVYLCRKLGAMMRAKGRSPAGYCIMLIGLWLFGEFAGGFVFVMMLPQRGGGFNPAVYLIAIVFAALGATATFLFAKSRPSLLPGGQFSGGFPVIQRPPQQ